MHGATVYASSADATFPAPGGPVPGAGAFVAALHYATGVLAKTAGKPSPAMFEEARSALGPGATSSSATGSTPTSPVARRRAWRRRSS